MSTCFLLSLLSVSVVKSASFDSSWSSAYATYHNWGDGTIVAACGFDFDTDTTNSNFPYGLVAALGTDFFDSGAGCGACYEVKCLGSNIGNTGCTCTSDTVVIRGVDSSGITGHFDLYLSAFDVIADRTSPSSCGSLSVEYRRVTCDFTSNIQIKSKSGVSDYWYGLQVSDVADYGTICNIYIRSNGGGANDWMECTLSSSFWVCNDNAFLPLTAPLDVRLTDCLGETLTAIGAVTDWTSEGVYDFGSNFAITGGSTGTPVTTTEAPVVVDGTDAIAPDATTVTVTECLSAESSNFVWTSEDHVLKLNGERFNMKAVSWFGFDTSNCVVHGLWSVSYSSLLDFLADNDFNAIRIPITVYAVVDGCVPSSVDSGQNAGFPTDSFFSALDFVIEACAERGILVMLDMHSLVQDDYLADLWYSDAYSVDTVIGAWTTLATRYADTWNVFAADVFNEPHGGTWGDGAATDWKIGAQNLGNAIHAAGADWLIMVQGIANGCSPENCFWGENLESVATDPVTLDTDNKVVYSPHTYGPSVYEQSYFSASNYPENMPAIWDDHFGYIRSDAALSEAITVGEWGGFYTGTTQEWMDEFVDYLLSIDAPDTFFWCLNPNSGDTGGLLGNDWSTPETAKLELLATLQPNPTLLSFDGELNQVCYDTTSTNSQTSVPQSTAAEGTATTQSDGVTTQPSDETTQATEEATQDGNVPTDDGEDTPETTVFNYECEWTDDYILGSVNHGVNVDSGSCGYWAMDNDTFPYRKIAAFGSEVWSDSLACGMCLEVRCVGSDNGGDDPCYNTESTITAMIGDRGATCDTYDCMGLSAEAYDELADASVNGMAAMEYRRIECPIDDNIVIVNAVNANEWWYSVVIENVAGAGVINSARLMDDATDATWVDGTRSSANSWVFTPGTDQNWVFTPPFTIELTDDTGEMLTSTEGVLNVETSISMEEFDFGSNFDTLVENSLYIDEYCAGSQYDGDSDANSIVYSKTILLATLIFAFIF